MKRLLILLTLLTLLTLLMLPLVTLANFGSSNSSAASQITLTVSQKSDSARATFYYPDMSTPIDSFKMIPIAVESGVNDSTLLRATIPADALTSIGTYVVKIAVFYKDAGSTSDYVLGVWEYSEIVDTVDVINSESFSISDIQAIIDTSQWWNSYGDGARSEQALDADRDTLKLYTSGSTKFARIIFIHEGGSPGDPPDSTRTILGSW